MNAERGRPSIWIRSLVLMGMLLAGATAIAAILLSIRVEPPRRDITTPVPLVEWMELTPRDVPIRSYGYGTAEPDRAARIAAEVPAVVVELVGDLEVGTHVESHQELIRLDDREYRHALARAESVVLADRGALAELAVDEDNLDRLLHIAKQELQVATDERSRVEGLYKQGRAARKEFDFAELAYRQAERVLQDYRRQNARIEPKRSQLEASLASKQAEVAIAQLNLERCTIRAPFAGAIDALAVEVGDRVGPGVVVAALLNTDRVEIPIRLPAGAYDDVMVHAACRVFSERMGGRSWTGRVARVAASVDKHTRTFAVFVEVDNTTQQTPLVPGMFVRADIIGPVLTDALMLPRSAIRDEHVVVAANGVVEKRKVRLRRIVSDLASVDGDLTMGDRIVLSHLDHLSDGMAVRLRDKPTTTFDHDAKGSESEGAS